MVTVYSKPMCKDCKKTKMDLEGLGIQFEEVDVTKNKEAFKMLKANNHRHLPVVTTDDDEWEGYRADKIRSMNTSENTNDDIWNF